MPKTKKRDSTKSKQLILQNAIKLFAKNGYKNSSMDELASMCDLNKAMIFYYYKNKKKLYEAVIIEILDQIYTKIITTNNTIINAKDKLESFIQTFTNFAWQRPYFSSLLLRELSNSNHDNISTTLFENMKKLYILFCNILKDGENTDFIKDCSKNSMMLYFMITGTINLMITTKNIRQQAYQNDAIDTCNKCNADDISSYITEQILHQILNKELK